MKPRVLFVGRSRFSLPLDPALARKWNAVAEELDIRVLATGRSGEQQDDASVSFPTVGSSGSTPHCRLKCAGKCVRSTRT